MTMHNNNSSSKWRLNMKHTSSIAALTLAFVFTMPGAWAQAASSATAITPDASTAKSYRLTYTLTEVDNGESAGTQHFSMIAVSGQPTTLKEGSKVPVSTGTYNASAPTQNNEVQYLDVGLNIDALLNEKAGEIRLRTKLEQSNVTEEKSPMSPQDPVIRQTQLESTSLLILGKPLMLGSIDIPNTTRRLDVGVVLEPVR